MPSPKLILHRTIDLLSFPGARKLIRIRIEGLIDGALPAIRCRLTGVVGQACLNGAREDTTVIVPCWENGNLIARFVIEPTVPGEIVATFTVGSAAVEPLELTLQVRPQKVGDWYFDASRTNGRGFH